MLRNVMKRLYQLFEDGIYRPCFLAPFLPAVALIELHHRWTRRRRV